MLNLNYFHTQTFMHEQEEYQICNAQHTTRQLRECDMIQTPEGTATGMKDRV